MALGVRASDHCRVRSFGGQAGQATIEWLAVAVGVVALSGALVTAMPPVAPQITSAFQTLICRVGGGSCAVSPPNRAAPAGAAARSTDRRSGARLRRLVTVAG
jgi:hypothetical protein